MEDTALLGMKSKWNPNCRVVFEILIEIVRAYAPFALKNITDVSFGDEMVVTLEPMIAMLANIRDVVSSFNCSNMIDHSKKGIPTMPSDVQCLILSLMKCKIVKKWFLHILSGGEGTIFLSIRGHIIVYVTTVRHERCHI